LTDTACISSITGLDSCSSY